MDEEPDIPCAIVFKNGTRINMRLSRAAIEQMAKDIRQKHSAQCYAATHLNGQPTCLLLDLEQVLYIC